MDSFESMKIDFFHTTPPPSQFNFTLLSCAFIWRLHNAVLRRVPLCQAVRGCKGSSSRGMKWAQTSASKWFLSLGQTPTSPPSVPLKMSPAGGPKEPEPHRGRTIEHLRRLISPSALTETLSFVRSRRTPCSGP